MDETIASTCRRFFDAIERGDVEAAAALYAPNAVIWHNTDEVATSREASVAVVRDIARNLHDRRYADRRVATFATGFVQQHILIGRLADGTGFRLPACVVGTVEHGLIVRFDEYYDQLTVDRQTAPHDQSTTHS